MSDQASWAKLWGRCLTDPDLEELELHQWARWARLLIFLKVHGEDGKLIVSSPARALQNTLRTRSFEELTSIINMLPSYSLLAMSQTASQVASQVTNASDNEYMLICKNWNKYQGDLSNERTKKWRQRKASQVASQVTSNVTPRREEKRRDVKSTSTSTSLASQDSRASASAHPAPTPAQKAHENGNGSEMPSAEDIKRSIDRNLGPRGARF